MTWGDAVLNWPWLRTQLRERWGRLTPADLRMVRGNKDCMVRLLVDRYGYESSTAHREVDEFCRSCSGPADAAAPVISNDFGPLLTSSWMLVR